MRRYVLSTFARAFGIDVDEAEGPLESYATVNAFFVRRLKPGTRAWPADPGSIGSPVDGIVGQLGTVREGRLMQAKGRLYSVADLLGDDRAAEAMEGGSFLTLYLAPRHYHRIHAPWSGAIPAARHVPGALLPVNEPSVRHVADLFARNERVVCQLHGAIARGVVVAVGAYNVGRISTAFDPTWGGGEGHDWVMNRMGDRPRDRTYAPPVRVERGDEIMAFHLGSTVVMVLEPGGVRLDDRLRPGDEVRLGDIVAGPEG
jgi:phosphatidylserine decarboxylase